MRIHTTRSGWPFDTNTPSSVAFYLRLCSSFRRKPESILTLPFALRPDVLAPGRGGYGRRHIYRPHPFRIRARRALPQAGSKCGNESKNQKMDSVEPSLIGRLRHRNDGGFSTSGGFFNNPLKGGVILPFSSVASSPCLSGLSNSPDQGAGGFAARTSLAPPHHRSRPRFGLCLGQGRPQPRPTAGFAAPRAPVRSTRADRLDS